MTNIKSDSEYKKWLSELKLRIRQSQIKAAVKVNVELLKLYWNLGKNIVTKQAYSQWGDGIIKQLSIDLKREFPKMQGLSGSNIKYMRQWYLFYNKYNTIGQQAVGQLETSKVL